MGIFDFLNKKNPQLEPAKETAITPEKKIIIEEEYYEIKPKYKIAEEHIRNVECFEKAICPYCDYNLNKAPGRKKQCPQCNNYIIVRTNYAYNKKMLLTESQAERIDCELSQSTHRYLNIAFASEQITKKQIESIKLKNPNRPELLIVLDVLEHKGSNYKIQNDWGLYRNNCFYRYNLYLYMDELDSALKSLIEVFYLDLNGSNNSDKPFNLNYSEINSSILLHLYSILDIVHITKDQLKQEFINQCNSIKKANMPLTPEKAWIKLSKSIDI